MNISNKIGVVEKQVEIGDITFLYKDGKYVVLSFTRTSIRFKSLNPFNKDQTVNRNTFLKKHIFTEEGYWKLSTNIKSINMDYI